MTRLSDANRLDVWRTTVFRFISIACAVAAVGTVALLGLIYRETASELNGRNDRIVQLELDNLLPSTPEALPRRIEERQALNVSRNTRTALYSHDGALVAGDIPKLPPGLKLDGRPHEIDAAEGLPSLRAKAVLTPWGETLVVARDSGPLRQVRAIILHALLASGALIAAAGLGCAYLLSLSPLRRLRELTGAGVRIASGELHVRMPVSRRRDELDLLASTVNTMMAEVERLMVEVKSATDAAAHDLRTPLTRVRAQLHRLGHAPAASAHDRAVLEEAIAGLDEVLERFTALLRISELETQVRRAGFGPVDLAAVIEDAFELYEPLAEAQGVRLKLDVRAGSVIEADQRLVFEAVSNLVDNAIKFSAAGETVHLQVRSGSAGPEIVVRDRGPGIAADERAAVLQRFYRTSGAQSVPGHGLGLSLVAAIARLHRFDLQLEDARPGLEVILACGRRLR